MHDQPRTGFTHQRRRPSLLSDGARVALVAPAGPLRDARDLQRAVDNACLLGWEPIVMANALDRSGYFAGEDARRAMELNRALTDDTIDGVWCLRGGYGTMRILNAIDYDAVARRPKPVIGYSDITALHAALMARAGIVAFHGPTARAELTEFSRESLYRAVVTGCDSCGVAPAARTIRPGRAEGVLAGGNLAVLAALAGTAYAPRFHGAIVVLEDIDEAVYRIDRMLRQLLMAGMLDGARALAFGACTNCPEAADDGARPLDEVVGEVADILGVPAVCDIPVGHIADQWTIPLGALGALDADARTLTVLSTLTTA
jgi:muramoyltetrapeptide carboxypeptidase